MERPQVTAWLADDAHPALDAPMGARVDYACVVAAFVGSGPVDADQVRRLRLLCRVVALPPHLADGVLAATAEPTERVRERLYRLGGSPLCLRLVRDMVLLGYRDGEWRYGPADRRKVRGLATLMMVGEDQIRDIEDEVASDLHADGREVMAESEDAPGAWAGVMRLYQKLVGTLSDG